MLTELRIPIVSRTAAALARLRADLGLAPSPYDLGREDAGLFYGGGLDQLGTQLLFVIVHFVFVVAAAGGLFYAIKKYVGLRVSEEEELAGLDVLEHGSPGYGSDPRATEGSPVGVGGGAPTRTVV